MALNKAQIALKDNALAGYLNVTNQLISKAQDNQTKIALAEAIVELEATTTALQALLQSNDPTLDNIQEIVDEVKTVVAFINTIDTNGELSAVIDAAVGGSWWRTDFNAQNLQNLTDKAAALETLNAYSKTAADNLFFKKGLIQRANAVVSFTEGAKNGFPNPLTGAYTFDFNGAIEGAVTIMRHNASNKPAAPAEGVEIGGDYTNDVINYIFLTPIKISSAPDVWEVLITYNQKLN